MDERIQQLMQRVRRIEIKTRALSNHAFAGEYRSAFKGRGMSFSEVREYQPGDDVRDIDWNVTARFERTYVKVYEEERELTVMLLVDVSGSLDFGTQVQSQRERLTEIAATIAFSAMQGRDKIGVIFCSDRVEKYIPPAKGKGHILRIIRELLTFEPASRRTDLSVGLEFFMRVVRKRSVAFILSDFVTPINDILQRRLSMARGRHDLVAVRVTDPRMISLPDVGLMRVEDAETGATMIIDTSSPRVRKLHAEHWHNHAMALDTMLKRCKVDYVSVASDADYVGALKQLFARRS